MKRILLIVFLLMYATVMRVDAIGRHGSFSRVGKFPGFSNGAVILNSSEIFYPGHASDGKNPAETAKIYDIHTKKMTDLKSVMNVYRTNYITTKYDSNHVLIVGGSCENSETQELECNKAAEIYNIKENTFTRISDSNIRYIYRAAMSSLSDGRVVLYNFSSSKGYGEIFNPKTRTFTKVPDEILYYKPSNVPKNLMELSPNEVLLYRDKSNYDKECFAEIWDLRNNKLSQLQIKNKSFEYNSDYFRYYVGTPVKISSDIILFVGAGRDKKDLLKLNLKTKELEFIDRLPSALAGEAVLLNNNQILLYSGELKSPTYLDELVIFKGKGVVWAIYDYENNKVYKRRTTSFNNISYSAAIVGQNNVYFDTGFTKKWILYKYSY